MQEEKSPHVKLSHFLKNLSFEGNSLGLGTCEIFFRTVGLLIEESLHSKERNLLPLTQKRLASAPNLLIQTSR